ncbi:hypothetical protein AB0N28_04375 [Streptomyces sp. NPDC051130]|uniref:hypothetical protein n=1 Tax=Streptomyces sp. NPDC051130 TaxID=3157223 RepID=UPI00341AE6A5
MHSRAWTHAEVQVALFNQAMGWVRRNRVLLLGVPVVAKQVAMVRSPGARQILECAGARPGNITVGSEGTGDP